MSVEQSCAAPAAEPEGFGGREEEADEPDAADDAESAAAALVAVLAAAEVALEDAEAALDEVFELLHPAASSTARAAAAAVPIRVPTVWPVSEVFIRGSMPCVAEQAVANSTTFLA
jgi:hypothetical protein